MAESRNRQALAHHRRYQSVHYAPGRGRWNPIQNRWLQDDNATIHERVEPGFARRVLCEVIVCERRSRLEKPHPADAGVGVQLDTAVVIEVLGVGDGQGDQRSTVAMESNSLVQLEVEYGIAVCDHEGVGAQKSAQAV